MVRRTQGLPQAFLQMFPLWPRVRPALRERATGAMGQNARRRGEGSRLLLLSALMGASLIGTAQAQSVPTEADTQTLPPYSVQPPFSGILPEGFPLPPEPPIPPVVPPLPGETQLPVLTMPSSTPPEKIFSDSAAPQPRVETPKAEPKPTVAPTTAPRTAPAAQEPKVTAVEPKPNTPPVTTPPVTEAPTPLLPEETQADAPKTAPHPAAMDEGSHRLSPEELVEVVTGAEESIPPVTNPVSDAEILPATPDPTPASRPTAAPAPTEPERDPVLLSEDELQILPDNAKVIEGAVARQRPVPNKTPQTDQPRTTSVVEMMRRRAEAEAEAAAAAEAEEHQDRTARWPDEPTQDFAEVDGFRVGYVPQFPSGSLFVMVEEKWPQAVGFEVAPKTFRRMEAMAARLRSGELDMAYFDPAQFLKLRHDGVRLMVLAGTMVDSSAFVVRGSLGRAIIAGEATQGLRHWVKVNTPRLTVGTGERMTVRRELFRAWAVESGRIGGQTLRLPGADLEQVWRAMLGHRILGALVPEPMVSTIIVRDPGARIALDGTQMGSGLPNLVLVATPRAIAARRGQMVDFIGMHLEGQDMMKNNPGRAGYHMARYIGYGHLNADEMARALLSPINRYEADPTKITPGLVALQKMFLEEGVYGQAIDPVDLVNPSLYREASRSPNKYGDIHSQAVSQ